MIFLVLGWFALYHGALLWLALRFKDKPWRWWWFGGVLAIGLVFGWFDQVFISTRLERDWCQRAEIGFKELVPAKPTVQEVTWLPLNDRGADVSPAARVQIAENRFIADGAEVMTTNRMYCKQEHGSRRGPCLVAGYLYKKESRDIHIFGRFIAKRERFLLLKNGEVLRDSINYRWGQGWFMEVFFSRVPNRYPFACVEAPVLWKTEELIVKE